MKKNIIFQNIKPFGQVVMLFVTMALCFILYTGVSVALVLCGVNAMDVNVLRCSQILGQLMMFASPALLWALFSSEGAGQGLCLHFRSRHWLLLLLGVVCFALLSPFIDALTAWNQSWQFSGAWATLGEKLRQMTEQSEVIMSQFLQATEVKYLLFNLLVMAVVPAVCEELFFRGALQTIAVRWLGNAHVAVVMVALVFSLLHGDIFGLVPRWLMGIALGYLFYYGGSLWVNVAAHFLNNATIVMAYYLYNLGVITHDPELPWHLNGWIVALCTVVSVAIFLRFFVLKRKISMKQEMKNTP